MARRGSVPLRRPVYGYGTGSGRSDPYGRSGFGASIGVCHRESSKGSGYYGKAM